GEGAGVSGRAADGRDVQRGRARQPAIPEDAEDRVPGADATGDRAPPGAGPDSGESGPRTGRDDQDLAQGQSGVIRLPGFLATVSVYHMRYCKFHSDTGRWFVSADIIATMPRSYDLCHDWTEIYTGPESIAQTVTSINPQAITPGR